MNQVLHEGAEAARMGWLLGFTTLLFFGTMIAWTVWAYAPSRRVWMEQAGRIPLDGGDA
ncbi:MAG: CcoQ/FixQ family Cbb3-type cytochrome c oxidase assembly chaperone [Myxococcota bacterium]